MNAAISNQESENNVGLRVIVGKSSHPIALTAIHHQGGRGVCNDELPVGRLLQLLMPHPDGELVFFIQVVSQNHGEFIFRLHGLGGAEERFWNQLASDIRRRTRR